MEEAQRSNGGRGAFFRVDFKSLTTTCSPTYSNARNALKAISAVSLHFVARDKRLMVNA